MFHIGQEVVYIRDDGQALIRLEDENEIGVVKGRAYHIRGFSSSGGIYTEEIINPKHPKLGFERAFKPDRFAPIQKKSTETGMSILIGILNRESDGVAFPVKPVKPKREVV